MMHTNIAKHTLRRLSAALFLVLLLFAIPVVLRAEMTSIENTISVSSDGGTSRASVQTYINGELVEDEEWHGSGTIHRAHTVRHGSAASETTIASKTEADEETRAQIKALIALIEYYISLLNDIS